ncbi:MAG: recombinase family protein, partial [Mucispirillum sp.]|nr:recombinase family protein [Mucispirillum sp.]
YKTHNGAKFQANTINRILRHHTYTGYFVRGGKRSTYLEHFKIVDETLFNEAQKILEARNNENVRKSSIAYTTRGAALLSGNIFCEHCGSKMHAISYQDPYTMADGTRKVYRGIKYICPNRARKRGECVGQSQYNSTKIDEAVIFSIHTIFDRIKGMEKDETLKKKYEEAVSEKKKEYNALLKEYDREQAIMKKLIESVGQAVIGESTFSLETLNAAINAEKEKMARIAQLIPQALKTVNDEKETLESLDTYYENFIGWADEYDKASRERQKMIICNLIDKIIIGKDYNLKLILNLNYQQFLG